MLTQTPLEALRILHLSFPVRSSGDRRIPPRERRNHTAPTKKERPRRGIPPFEPSTYKELLQRSTKTLSLILCKLVHSHMIRVSYKPGLFMHNVLLNAYCKCGNMVFARKVFDQMPLRDSVTWNTLAAGYSQIGSADGALAVFKEARIVDTALDQFSYAGALSACGDKGDVKTGRIIHGLVVVAGLAHRTFIVNSLLDMYSKCRMIDEVRLVFDRADELDEESWNILLSAYVHIGWPEVAVNILVWMHRAGVKLNSFALSSVLKVCSDFKDDADDLRRMLHGCVTKVGLDLDLFVGSAMLDMYAKNGGLDEAITIFKCIPNPSVVVFNAMIAGFSRLGTKTCNKVRLEALRLFSEMLRRRIRPSKFTFKSVIEACNSTNALKCGRQIHAQVILNGLQDEEFIGSALITLYSRSGFIEASLRCFELTAKQEMITWTSMISAYIQNEHFERALRLFKELLSLGRKPDQFSLSTVMSACSNLGLLRTGEQIQGYTTKLGHDKFTVLGNLQIDMYAKTGDFGASRKTFQDIGSLDVVSWSAMISSHALHGTAGDGLVLFDKMVKCKVKPDNLTFLVVLTACSHGGLLDDGFRCFQNMMTDYGLAPRVEHCACIVDLLGRAGRLIDAEDFILSSIFASNPVLWNTLLRACLFHGDTETGIRVGERLMTVEPLAAASYMALYNMYLDVGKISLAMRTRGLMRERGLNKEAGVSWIEIGPFVHSFVASSIADPHIDAVYAKLEEILSHVKQKKGKSGTKFLESEYRSEKWRESILNSHNELLAVAFGMSNLPEFAVIRVFKNMRVCIDCHVLLKLLSETERQEIVLRDSTRFHHFSWGSCSCGDYW